MFARPRHVFKERCIVLSPRAALLITPTLNNPDSARVRRPSTAVGWKRNAKVFFGLLQFAQTICQVQYSQLRSRRVAAMTETRFRKVVEDFRFSPHSFGIVSCAFASDSMPTLVYRADIAGLSCPTSSITTLSGTPASFRIDTAEWRRL